MALYANIKNPLRVNNREDLRYRLTGLSDTYSTLIAREALLDREYSQKYEDAQKAWSDYVSEWSKKNPGAPRTAIYDDPKYQAIDEAEDAVLDEWQAASTELAAEIKDAITSALEDNGYDGIILLEDKGSFGRSTDAYIALHPEQVKNVDNKKPTSDPDIRYSRRDSAEGLTKEEARAQAAAYTRLKAENAELRRRVEYWKGQTRRTKQATVRQADVNRFARQLIKRYGSRADQAYIRQALQEMGDYLLLLWASLPDALPTQEAARRIGVNPQRLHELIRAGKLHGVKNGRVQYCVKREIIAYAAAPARLAHPCGEVYKALVAGYWKEREKQPGDCFAYSVQSPGAML